MLIRGVRRTAVVTALAGLTTVAVGAGSAHSAAGSRLAATRATIISSDIGSVTVAPRSKVGFALGTQDSRAGKRTFDILRRSGGRWHRQSVRGVGTYGTLDDIAAGSPRVAWAVGDTASGDAYEPLILASTGGGFRPVSIKHAAGGALSSVAASSATNAWATGAYIGITNPELDKPKVSRWDGHSWRDLDDNAQHGYGGIAVATTGPTNTWILANKTHGASAARWNGHSFAATTLPGGHQAAPQDLATTGPRNVWVVGWQRRHGHLLPYIVHWNGTGWTRVHSPLPQHNFQLTSIAAAGRRVYAAGVGFKSQINPKGAQYLMRFVRGRWRLVSTPHRGSESSLDAIAVSTKLGLAGGNYGTRTSRGEPTERAYAAVLNGSRWRAVAVPK